MKDMSSACGVVRVPKSTGATLHLFHHGFGGHVAWLANYIAIMISSVASSEQEAVGIGSMLLIIISSIDV